MAEPLEKVVLLSWIDAPFISKIALKTVIAPAWLFFNSVPSFKYTAAPSDIFNKLELKVKPSSVFPPSITVFLNVTFALLFIEIRFPFSFPLSMVILETSKSEFISTSPE